MSFQDATRPWLLAWLREILVNTARNHRRDHTADKRDVRRDVSFGPTTGGPVEPAAGGPSPSSLLARGERDAVLERAVEQLPEHYRQVVLLHNRDNLSFVEVGQQSGQAADAAIKTWVRALRLLRELLEKTDGAP